MGQRYLALDGLRGLAAIFVVIWHMAPPGGLSYPFSSAYLAVDLFFGLSGFVISHTYDSRLVRGMTFSHFMWRRLARLYPTYLVGLLLGVTAYLTMTQNFMLDRFVTAVIPAMLLLPLPQTLSFPFDAPAWSLSLELLANIAFASSFSKLSRGVLATVLLIAAIVLCVHAQKHGSLDIGWGSSNFWGGPPRACYSFFAGVLLHRFLPNGFQGGLLIVILALFALALPVPISVHAVYDLCFVLLGVPIILAAGAGLQLRAVPARIARILGDISYPLYIIHWPVLLMWKSFTHDRSAPQTFVADAMGLAVLAGMSWLLARFYEQPLKRWLQSERGPSERSEYLPNQLAVGPTKLPG